jgi:hypothetical protein
MSQSRPLDGHTDALAVAYVATDPEAHGISYGTIGTRRADIDPLPRTRQAQATRLVFVSEAGPCGYWLSRSYHTTGDAGWVVAPARMPKQPGDRDKTARREARQLARLMRSGDLPPVYVPPGKLRRSVPSVAPVKRHSVSSRRPHCASTPSGCGMTSAIPGRPPGEAPLRWLSAVVWATPAPQLVC